MIPRRTERPKKKWKKGEKEQRADCDGVISGDCAAVKERLPFKPFIGAQETRGIKREGSEAAGRSSPKSPPWRALLSKQENNQTWNAGVAPVRRLGRNVGEKIVPVDPKLIRIPPSVLRNSDRQSPPKY